MPPASPSNGERNRVASRFRYYVVAGVFTALFASLAVRAAWLQLIDNDYIQSQGDARYLRVQKQLPSRGMIVDRFGHPLAVSTPVDSIWAHPQTVLDSGYALIKLAALLGTSPDQILAHLRANQRRQFVYLKRHLAPAEAQQTIALGVPGVHSIREYRRYYPAGPVTGHLLGFTNIDDVGQEGMELAYDAQLTGQPGATRILRDRVGHAVENVEQLTPVRDGGDVRISIDARVQYLAYRHLMTAVKRHNAAGASLVAVDAQSGEVLAMVNAPDFNPNNRAELRGDRFRNRAITDLFEPGSTIKPFTVAMALEHGVVDADTEVDVNPGHFYIGRNVIRDTHNYGVLSVAKVITKSSNIGAAKLAMMLDADNLIDTLSHVGFGKRADIGLPGERAGTLIRREQWRPIEHATLSYGYGLAVTTLQLARAYTVFVNDGRLLPLTLRPVERAPQGEPVFSSAVATEVRDMLESVTSDIGTARRARVEKYRVAGKTGTVHRLIDGRYDDDSYVSVFVGYAPASAPDMIVAVAVTDPRGDEYYGGAVAAPVFSKVMEGALRLRNVPPDNLPQQIDPRQTQLAHHAGAVGISEADGHSAQGGRL